MPGKESTDRPAEPGDTPAGDGRAPLLSRRSVLRGGAIAGAVGIAAAVGGGAGALGDALTPGLHRIAAQSPANLVAATGTAAAPGPIVIYLADPRSGEIDVFAGTARAHHTNRSLAAMVASLAPRVV
jgi:hypothetical protein